MLTPRFPWRCSVRILSSTAPEGGSRSYLGKSPWGFRRPDLKNAFSGLAAILRANPMRIVSLLPSATEICFALGLGDDVVGVSPECDFPRAVREKPVVSHGLLEYEGKTSRETSRMVGERIVSGGTLYQVDESALRSSRADLILTQGLCNVCAPTLGDVKDIARHLPRTPAIESFDPHQLEDVLENILRVGRACGIEDRASEVVAVLH